MLSVQSIPPSSARTHWKSCSAVWSGTSRSARRRTRPSPGPRRRAAMSSTYELPATWRTQPALTALSTSASAASNCSWVSVAGSEPRSQGGQPDRVAHLVEVGHLAGELVAEQDVERGLRRRSSSGRTRGRSCPTATARRGSCPGRTSGRGRSAAGSPRKFGVFAVSIVSSQPRRMSRAIIQSVMTTRSHSVGRPASSGPDRWVVKKVSLPSMAST